ARANLFGIIRQVNDQQAPVLISPASGGKGAVVISEDEWRSIEETLYLEATGTLAKVRAREADDSGITDVDDIDWTEL
ncbi:MAG: type II toxin-antitoxin system prevent-host-death family antitoxin, partial [Propionibacteriaceae bacterium]|nr:type II toxin-antitoxin system prevent-host-death family antitoxin [Propionibacteriaceae bacterium]